MEESCACKAFDFAIETYLAHGGLWNPELMDRQQVSALIQELRDKLELAEAQYEALLTTWSGCRETLTAERRLAEHQREKMGEYRERSQHLDAQLVTARQQVTDLQQELAVSRTNHIDANERNMRATERAEAAEQQVKDLTAAQGVNVISHRPALYAQVHAWQELNKADADMDIEDKRDTYLLVRDLAMALWSQGAPRADAAQGGVHIERETLAYNYVPIIDES